MIQKNLVIFYHEKNGIVSLPQKWILENPVLLKCVSITRRLAMSFTQIFIYRMIERQKLSTDFKYLFGRRACFLFPKVISQNVNKISKQKSQHPDYAF